MNGALWKRQHSAQGAFRVWRLAQQLPGVIETAVGYEGGKLDNPTYKCVCADRTGHAEVVEVKFDPAKVGYHRVLHLFSEKRGPLSCHI